MTGRLGPALAAATLAAAVAGCGGSDEPGEPAAPVVAGQPGGTVVVATLSDPDSWTPYTTRRSSTADLLDVLYPRLVREDAAAPGETFEPWLAKSWSFSEDRRRLTFELRADARWSDGSPVTCDDVRFTFDVQTDEALGWAGARYKERIEGVDCPRPSVAVFRFSEAYPDQLLDANDNAIVPRAYGDVPVADWRATPWQDRLVTCGPYRVAESRPGQQVVLERDPRWWDADAVGPDRVVLRQYPDQTSAFRAFLAGDLSVLPGMTATQFDRASTEPHLRVSAVPSLSYTFIAWNVVSPDAYAADRARRDCTEGCAESADDIRRLQRRHPHPILASSAVRRALTLSIDRVDLVDGLWRGGARVTDSPIISTLWAHREQPAWRFDPAAARELLDEAGWIDTDGDGTRDRDGRPLRLRIATYSGHPLRVDTLERVAESLAAVGVDVEVVLAGRAEFVRNAWDRSYDGVLSGWRAGTRVEPHLLFHTEAAVDRGNNLGGWSTPESDALLERGSRASTRAEARDAWTAWQELFRKELPYTMLYEQGRWIGFSRDVVGPDPDPLNLLADLHRWRVAQRGSRDAP